MSAGLAFAIVCGLLALVYGIWAVRSVMSESAGNERMQEIAAAIQEGAKAYLGRQYTTIAIVGVIVAAILFLTLNAVSTIGFVVGAVLSGVARAARGGVLVKGGGPLENLGSLTAIAFDKTGTLTQGQPQITDIVPMVGVAEDLDLDVARLVDELLEVHR